MRGQAAPSVLMVCARFAPFVGGVETHVQEVAAHMVRRGLTVEVLTTDPTRRLPRHARIDDVDVQRVAAYPSGRDWYLAPGVARVVVSRQHDLVHVQGIHTLVAPLAMFAAIKAGTPFISTFHTGGHPSALRRRLRTTQWRLLSPLLRRADALVAVSEFERDLVGTAARVDPSRIALIRNGAGLPEQAAKLAEEDPDLIISVGRLERYKGHHRAVAAMPELLRVRPAARLVIVGDGPERKTLLELAEARGVGEHVSVQSIPASDREAMARLVGRAALVVLLSEYEAHPVAVTEARSLGRRVLVAETSGLIELVTAGEVHGIRLEASAAELATEMGRLLREPPEAPRVRVPTWQDCADELIALYRQVALSRSQRRGRDAGPLTPDLR